MSRTCSRSCPNSASSRQTDRSSGRLAPFNRDSGTLQGKRTIWGGRARVRSTLYMAAVAAMRCNPVLKRFYRALRDGEKPAKVALTACMRKLIVLLNSLLRDGVPWSPEAA